MYEKLRQLPVRTVAVVLAVGWLTYALHTVGLVGDALPSEFYDWLYNGLLLASAGLCGVRAALVKRDRLGWAAISGGLLLWTGGDIYWSLVLEGAAEVPVPSLADGLYLAVYPAVFWGLGLIMRARGGVSRDLWLDGAIAALSVSALAAAVAFAPIRAAAEGDGLSAATNLAYPIGDLLLLGLVVLAFALTGWRPDRALALFGAGLIVMALGDAAFLLQSARGSDVEGTLLDAAWPASALLMGLAACQRPAPPAASAEDRRRMVVPCACGLLALGVIGVGLIHGIGYEAAMLAMTALLFVTARMGLAFSDGQRALATSRRQALTDGLTGLGNRRHLMDDLERELAQADPAAPRLCVLLDLDGFKSYNDTFGHPLGDQLLARLGRSLAAAADPYGRAYRLGGDEFCVLARYSPPAAETVVEQMREALSELGEGFHITASAGAARFPEEARSATEVLHIADSRMYLQKEGSSSRRQTRDGRASVVRQTRDVLLRALQEREPGLHDHIDGIARLAVAVARELGMSHEDFDEVGRAAELHDIGKIAMPEAILHKPGPLDEEEWAFIRRHPVIGERILGAAAALRPVARLVRSSHERWDGAGYPDGLAGEEIPAGARVVAVCDAYDAMITDRSHRPALDTAAALQELRVGAGTQFDPAVIEAFCTVVQRIADGAGAPAAGAGPSSEP